MERGTRVIAGVTRVIGRVYPVIGVSGVVDQ
jgi:hypothetical protein